MLNATEERNNVLDQLVTAEKNSPIAEGALVTDSDQRKKYSESLLISKFPVQTLVKSNL